MLTAQGPFVAMRTGGGERIVAPWRRDACWPCVPGTVRKYELRVDTGRSRDSPNARIR